MRIFIILASAGGRDAAGIISGHTRAKVTVYLWTICSGDNTIQKALKEEIAEVFKSIVVK